MRVLAQSPDQTRDMYFAEDRQVAELEKRQLPPAAPNPNSVQYGLTPAPTTTSIPLYGQTQTTTSVSVNLTPFGGTPIPWVPSQSLNSVSVTTSSTAGFPPLTGYPACVTLCLAHAAYAANCSSVIAVNCYCSNPIFSQALVNCTAQSCLINLYAAENLAQQYCNLAAFTNPGPATGSIPALPTTLSFPSPPTTSSSPTFPTSITPVSIITGAVRNGDVRAARISMKEMWDGGVKGAAMSVVVGIVGVFIGALLV
ncbi:hypothetical protein EDC04DRAFT_2652064 [Pisolithus marmoratus]|nr:hypothetical protein EDC04DRAFT_2652064 [Pisolithus marmoratus]